MTREEAIQRLYRMGRPHVGIIDENTLADNKALSMAIEALSNADQHVQRVGSVDLISRQDAIDALGEEPDIWNDTEEEWAYRNAWVEHILAIKSLPSAGQNCVLCEYYTEIETDDGIKGKCTRRTGSDLISRQDVIRLLVEKYKFTTKEAREILAELPSAEPKTDDESELKFYYVESINDYWVGRRLDNFYYANWHEGLGFVWSHSRYLPWGEHIVDENTLWKEHTYPSEPIEIPFTEWIVGFVKKYFAEPKTGKWQKVDEQPYFRKHFDNVCCSVCHHKGMRKYNYCPNCGADMRGEEE